MRRTFLHLRPQGAELLGHLAELIARLVREVHCPRERRLQLLARCLAYDLGLQQLQGLRDRGLRCPRRTVESVELGIREAQRLRVLICRLLQLAHSLAKVCIRLACHRLGERLKFLLLARTLR